MKAPPPERTGLLIVRLWIEATADGTCRARITQTLDSADTLETMSSASSPDQIYAIVRAWVEAFVSPN